MVLPLAITATASFLPKTLGLAGEVIYSAKDRKTSETSIKQAMFIKA
jgi:hypothetical protein